MLEDPLGGMLFALVHFHTLYPITTTHPTCVFLLLADGTHIVGLTSNMLLIFLQLHEEFGALGFLVQLTKCIT
jgi:hypothetical protein